MLHELGWTTLELRTTMTRLALLYKMSRGQIDVDTETYLNPNTEFRTRASHQYRYTQDKDTKNTYFYSIFPRTIRAAFQLSVFYTYVHARKSFNSSN